MQCRVFAASAIGKSHIDGGLPCQDAFAFNVVEDVVIAAVCDGAGSAALSHIGSNLMAKSLVEMATANYQAGELLHVLDAEAFKSKISKIITDVRTSLEGGQYYVPAGKWRVCQRNLFHYWWRMVGALKAYADHYTHRNAGIDV